MSQKAMFIDSSGSTANSHSYWSAIGNHINNTHKDAKLYLWDATCRATDTAFVNGMVIRKDANGPSTTPQSFAGVSKSYRDIVIITDGRIHDKDVVECDSVLDNHKFGSVELFFYSTGGVVNLSVAAAFMRNADRYRIVRDGQELSSGSTSAPINLQYDDVASFLKDADDLLRRITAANLGRANNALRDGLIYLKNRLLRQIATANSVGVRDQFDGIRAMLTSNRYAEAIAAIKGIVGGGDDSQAKRVEAIMQVMLEACSGKNGFGFDNLVPGRLARAVAVTPQTPQDLAVVEEPVPKTDFVCPISLEDALPFILIVDGPGIFHDTEKSYVEAIMTNPLCIVGNADFVRRIAHRISGVMGSSTFNSMYEATSANGTKMVCPYTRGNISAVFPLGSHDTHVKARRHALENLFFGDRLPGNSTLWLGAFLLAVRASERLDREPLVIRIAMRSCFIEHAIKNVTPITFSGLPIAPMIKAPADIAIWWCVVSPVVTHGVNTIRPPTNAITDLLLRAPLATRDDERNRLKFFQTGMVELLELFRYAYEREWTLRQISRYRAVAWMMTEEKNNTAWRRRVLAQYQNHIVLGQHVVMLDGPAPANARDLIPQFAVRVGAHVYNGPTSDELVALARLVDRTKTTGDIHIPYNLQLVERTPVRRYGYPNDGVGPATRICPTTMRPYTIDRASQIHWTIAAERAFGDLNSQLWAYSYFVKYVETHVHYPTAAQFIVWMADKQEHRQDGLAKDTLPLQTQGIVDQLFAEYASVGAYTPAEDAPEAAPSGAGATANTPIVTVVANITPHVSPVEFNRRAAISRDRVARAFMDSGSSGEGNRFNPGAVGLDGIAS